MVTEDRTRFPPDYSGQQVHPEQIGRRPPPERCHKSKEACVAAAWADHDARTISPDHPTEAPALQGCLKLEGDPTDRETVKMTTTQWREQMALAHYNGAMLGMQALCRRAEVLAAEEEAADAATRGDLQ